MVYNTAEEWSEICQNGPVQLNDLNTVNLRFIQNSCACISIWSFSLVQNKDKKHEQTILKALHISPLLSDLDWKGSQKARALSLSLSQLSAD